MSDSQLWQIIWQQAGVGRFILALVCGVIVSVIYFMSLLDSFILVFCFGVFLI